MSHENYKNKLLQYFYQELPEPERKEFEAHLSKCPFCRTDLEDLKAMSLELNQAFDRAAVGDAVLGRIIEKARVTESKRVFPALLPKTRGLRWGLSFSAAALFLLALVISLWLVVMQPNLTAYDYNQLTENVGSLEQDFSGDSGDSETALLGSDDSNDSSLDSMEQEVTEIQVIANGVLDL
jgi:anti-sigma factor RsiW